MKTKTVSGTCWVSGLIFILLSAAGLRAQEHPVAAAAGKPPRLKRPRPFWMTPKLSFSIWATSTARGVGAGKFHHRRHQPNCG